MIRPHPKEKIPQVCVILESSLRASRARFQGVVKYLRLHRPWCLQFIASGTEGLRLPQSAYWKGDGFIARVPDPELAIKLLSQKKPVILLDPEEETLLLMPTCSRVSLDNELVARLAAEYFLNRGHGHFAFVEPIASRTWAILRRNLFVDLIEKNHFFCDIFVPNRTRTTTWEKERRRLSEWLRALPKPVAILAASDIEGREIIDACLSLRIGVPYEVAVLGIGNDDLLCNSCFPSLSSIDICWENGGFQAAALLDEKMRTRNCHQKILFYGPRKIVERASTEQIHLTDRLVVRIMEMIRLHDGMDLRVEDLARQFNVSRQWLQKRFKEEIGHSVIDEIQNRRLEKVKSLVSETELTFNEIGTLCGFESGNHLRVLFKKATGMTMSDYRINEKNRFEP